VSVLRAGSASDAGMVRSSNQDAVLVEVTAFAVADGMGGHAGGEIASAAAVESLRHSLATTSTAEGLLEALREANRAVSAAGADDPDLAGMGTTAVVAVLVGTEAGDRLLVANVGDSRAYLFHDGILRQVTDDHSMVGELLREGAITEEEAAHHPQRHVITRVLGTSPEVDVDLFELRLDEGDRVVLCSDGLSNEVSDEEIVRVLRTTRDPTAAAEDLVRRANAHGGNDNVSVVVVDAIIAEQVTGPTAIGVAARPVYRDTTPVIEKGDESWFARRRRLGMRRALTARVVLFILLVAGVVVGAVYFLRWYANANYFVKAQDSQILIYRGRQGGLLWFQPSKVATTSSTLADVPPAFRSIVVAGVDEPTLQAAKTYVSRLVEGYQPVTTSTVTTIPGVTTTTISGG
jgi:serine/threonine protein phosphatase PrpC